ncbi:MFS transporter [Streptosporangium sp. NPDC000239]|uniref:MFS transporter n=1 Tax=Streptosporangium sp. NPDC000239 TaxID=3154248 RepID=UPI00332E67E2
MADARADGATEGNPPVGVRTPRFRRLWWSWTISLCGDGVRFLALPLYVALRSRDPLATSAVAFAETLPWLLGALPAGAVVDRSPPRTVLVAAHGVRAVLTAVLVTAMAAGADSVALLCVFAFLLTLAETFADPASQVMMVHLAGPDDLQEANSRFYAVNTVAMTVIGPLAGGLVIAVNPVLAFTVDGLSFVAAALLVATLPAFPADAGATGTRLVAGVGESIRLLLGHPGLRTLATMVMVAGVASTAFDTLLPLYAVDSLGMGPRTVGSLVMAFGVATLAGTWLAPRLARRVSDGPVMITGMVVSGGGITLVGLVGTVAAAWTGVAMMGAGVGLWNVLSATRRQRLTPPGAMGRVSGAYRMMAWGLMPVGSGLAGVLAAATTLRVPILVAGLATILTIALLAVPLLRTGPARETP